MPRLERQSPDLSEKANVIRGEDIPQCMASLMATALDVTGADELPEVRMIMQNWHSRGTVSDSDRLALTAAVMRCEFDADAARRAGDSAGHLVAFRRARALDVIDQVTGVGEPRQRLRETLYEAIAATGSVAAVRGILDDFVA